MGVILQPCHAVECRLNRFLSPVKPAFAMKTDGKPARPILGITAVFLEPPAVIRTPKQVDAPVTTGCIDTVGDLVVSHDEPAMIGENTVGRFR